MDLHLVDYGAQVHVNFSMALLPYRPSTLSKVALHY